MPSHSAFDKAGFARIGRHPPLTPASVRSRSEGDGDNLRAARKVHALRTRQVYPSVQAWVSR